MGKQDIESCAIGAFCQLMGEKAYSQIRISEICERAHISRKTFYSHFEHKEALLYAVVERDLSSSTIDLYQVVTREGSGAPATNLLMELMFERVLARKDFYHAMCSAECEPLLIRVVSNTCANCHLLLADRSSAAAESQVVYASIYGSYGFAAVLVHWIKGGMITPPKQMARWIGEWAASSASTGF